MDTQIAEAYTGMLDANGNAGRVRPRTGFVQHRGGGLDEPVLYVEVPGQPEHFRPLSAVTGRPVTLRPGDALVVDNLGPGQQIVDVAQVLLQSRDGR